MPHAALAVVLFEEGQTIHSHGLRGPGGQRALAGGSAFDHDHFEVLLAQVGPGGERQVHAGEVLLLAADG